MWQIIHCFWGVFLQATSFTVKLKHENSHSAAKEKIIGVEVLHWLSLQAYFDFSLAAHLPIDPKQFLLLPSSGKEKEAGLSFVKMLNYYANAKS